MLTSAEEKLAKTLIREFPEYAWAKPYLDENRSLVQRIKIRCATSSSTTIATVSVVIMAAERFIAYILS